MPGGKPVIELPGETPTSPVTTVAPVLVTAEPPRTPKFWAVLSETCASTGEAWKSRAIPITARTFRVVRFMTLCLSDLDFLARCRDVAGLAEPSPAGELER